MPWLYAARRLLLMFWILFAIEPASSQTPAGTRRPKLDCGALNQLSINGVTSIRAEAVTSGIVKPPTGSAIKDLPSFWRVQIVASPVVGSDIHMEVWLPISDWNGRFLGTGNGGGGGRIYFPTVRAGLKRGFVTANTDLGTAPGPDSAVGQPEKWIDFGYRATHVMTVTFFRLYVIPGMGQGGGGPGLNSFGQLTQPKGDDVLYALEQWVEHGLPPDQFPAVGWNDANPAKGMRLRRNVCPYPAFPTYVSGDASQASSSIVRCAHAV